MQVANYIIDFSVKPYLLTMGEIYEVSTVGNWVEVLRRVINGGKLLEVKMGIVAPLNKMYVIERMLKDE